MWTLVVVALYDSSGVLVTRQCEEVSLTSGWFAAVRELVWSHWFGPLEQRCVVLQLSRFRKQ